MKNRWLATLALATACAAPLLVHAGTTKSEWKETLDCAVSTNLTAFDASPAGCWTVKKRKRSTHVMNITNSAVTGSSSSFHFILPGITLSEGRMTPRQPLPPPPDSSKTRTPC